MLLQGTGKSKTKWDYPCFKLCGLVCPKYFKVDFVYRTLWLQDSPTEDITSILYDFFIILRMLGNMAEGFLFIAARGYQG